MNSEYIYGLILINLGKINNGKNRHSIMSWLILGNNLLNLMRAFKMKRIKKKENNFEPLFTF